MILAYLKILDNDSRAYAVDRMADAGHDGQHIGDEPDVFLQHLRRQIESRIGHWLRIGNNGPVAALLPAVPTPEPGGTIGSLATIDLEKPENLNIEEVKTLAGLAIDALRKGKVKAKENPDGAKAKETEKAAKAAKDRLKANQVTRLATMAKATASYATSLATGATSALGRKKRKRKATVNAWVH